MVMMLNRIRDLFAGRSKQTQVIANLIDMWQSNRPLADVWDTKKFAEDGYRRCSLIFACIKIKSIVMAQPELLAWTEDKNGDESQLDPSHLLVNILDRGLVSGYSKVGITPRGSQTNFFRIWSIHLDVAGNAYAVIIRNAQGMPLGLKLLSRPDLVKPVPDSNGDVVEWVYGAEPNLQHIPATEMVHEMGNPDPLDPYRGLSPIAVLARHGDLDNFAADYLRAFFLNAGIPALMAKFKQQTEKPIRDRFKEQWKERYSGIRGWHNLFVTDTDIEIEEIGSKIRTMDLEQVFGQTESRICGVLGVHPILVAAWIGLMRSTMANYQQARQSLYNDTMLPIWTSTADRLTTDLAAEFGENITLRFNLAEVPELQRDKSDEKRLALEAWNSSLITRGEAREIWKMEATAEDDVFKVGSADAFEPAGSITNVQAPAQIQSRRESLRLIGPGELHSPVLDEQAKLLRQIADAATPGAKKKFSKRSLLPRMRRT
jgi:HK97 family phage portal protein